VAIDNTTFFTQSSRMLPKYNGRFFHWVGEAFASTALKCLLTLIFAQPSFAYRSEITAQTYLATKGGTLIPAGRTEIDGRVMSCGSVPTILDAQSRDFGASFPGFIVLNPNFFVGLSTPVKLWIFSHECSHQTVGMDEVKADCMAVQRGRREGWLTEDGLAQVCRFMMPARADSTHFAGSDRCALMQQCFSQYRSVDH
jgi:hypothetical protein